MPIRSIAIIPDGTRRWAHREKIELEAGYSAAFQGLLQTTIALLGRGLENIHIYMFSEFNLRRNTSEIISCLNGEDVFVTDLAAQEVPIRVHGNYGALNQYNPRFVTTLDRLSTEPPDVRVPTVHLYVCYSFANHIEELRSSCSIEALLDYLVRAKIDMVVRTGGARTLSDFLPTELRYSQLVFLDDLFNDVGTDSYLRLCDEYDRREQEFLYGN